MADRCRCSGQCGRLTGRRRACVEPDLAGFCRAEQGMVHPRSEQVVVIADVLVGPNQYVRLCQYCRSTFESGPIQPSRRTPGDEPYALFP